MSLGPARHIQVLGACFLLASTLIWTALMFVPWFSWDVDNGIRYEGTAGLWGFHERAGPIGHDSASWFSDRWTDDGATRDGVPALRAAAILGILALAGTAAGSAMVILDFRWRAGIVAALGAFSSVVAAGLVRQGTMAWASFHVEPALGAAASVGASLVAVLGTLMAFLPNPGLGVRDRFLDWRADRGS